jgi:NADH-quinone oxidoreductase subunit L
VAHNPAAGFAFWLLVIAALLTELLFLAADFHDLPRQAARFVDVMHHAHESPPVMLVPLFVLAVGALLAGDGVQGASSSAITTRRSGRARSSPAPTTTS